MGTARQLGDDAAEDFVDVLRQNDEARQLAVHEDGGRCFVARRLDAEDGVSHDGGGRGAGAGRGGGGGGGGAGPRGGRVTVSGVAGAVIRGAAGTGSGAARRRVPGWW